MGWLKIASKLEFIILRDAEDAVYARDGYDYDGYRLRVEFPKGGGGSFRGARGVPGRGGRGPPARRSGLSSHRVCILVQLISRSMILFSINLLFNEYLVQ